MKTILALGAAALLAAPALSAAPVNQFSEQLKKLPTIQQRAVLRRAVLDGGKYCKSVGWGAYQGPYKNLEMWSVRCPVGGDYGIFIGPDGTVQVRPCEDLVALKLPNCKLPK